MSGILGYPKKNKTSALLAIGRLDERFYTFNVSKPISQVRLVRTPVTGLENSNAREREPLLSTLSSLVIDQITDKKLPVDF